jgi:predicted methyltransferase
MLRPLLALSMATWSTVSLAQMAPPVLSPLGQQIEAALKSDVRTADERARDAERKPRQTLEFLGLAPGQRVVELVPAGGYYTKILAQVLREQGELYVALGTRTIEPLIQQVPALSRVRVAPSDAQMKPAAGQMGLFEVAPFSLGVTDADLVLTFRNYHNFTAEGRANLNRAVFAALKSGGRYGIVDHTRRHNEPDSRENWRRVDPVLVIKEVQAAGFVFEDFSGIHFTPDDELRYEVGRKSVAGNTDRFVLKFRKP